MKKFYLILLSVFLLTSCFDSNDNNVIDNNVDNINIEVDETNVENKDIIDQEIIQEEEKIQEIEDITETEIDELINSILN